MSDRPNPAKRGFERALGLAMGNLREVELRHKLEDTAAQVDQLRAQLAEAEEKVEYLEAGWRWDERGAWVKAAPFVGFEEQLAAAEQRAAEAEAAHDRAVEFYAEELERRTGQLLKERSEWLAARKHAARWKALAKRVRAATGGSRHGRPTTPAGQWSA